MKRILYVILIYLLFGGSILGLTLYGLVMWAEEVTLYGVH